MTELTIGQELKNEDLTLDEKLALIDQMVAASSPDSKSSVGGAAIDPAEALTCEGCQ